MKNKIEADIAKDFEHAYTGILQLPTKARFGVYVAYKYYLSLFKKIKNYIFNLNNLKILRIKACNISVVLPSFLIKIRDKSVKGFVGYDRIFK